MSDVQPPKWAVNFLRNTCHARYLHELEGDLVELFDRDRIKFGAKKARRNFIRKSLLSLRWYRMPNIKLIKGNKMWKNYFKVSVRHAIKYKLSTTVQITGMFLGFAAIFYIFLFLKNEFAYDKIHVNNQELYRVLRQNPKDGIRDQGTSSRHGQTLLEAYPFIEMCRFGNDPVKIGDEAPQLVEEFYWADSTFFDLFSFHFLEGNHDHCLSEVNSMVITESLRKKLFASKPALNKLIKIKVYDGDSEFLMKITGVVEDPPEHTHIQFAALGSMENAEIIYSSLVDNWYFSWVRTYVKVSSDRIAEIQSNMDHLVSNLGDQVNETFGITLQPFDQVYLDSQDIPGNTHAGNLANIRIFLAISLVILLLSIFNYINLTTARAATRLKEVGLRKILGSRLLGILQQFILESILFTLATGLVGILFLWVCLPYLNSYFDLSLGFQTISSQEYLLIIPTLILLGTAIGIVPAISMTKLPSLSSASSGQRLFKGNHSISRRLFVGLQFFMTLVLLVTALVIHKQYKYLQHYDLGFDSEQLIHIPVNDRKLQSHLSILREEMKLLPGVKGAAATGEDLPSRLNNTWSLEWIGDDREIKSSIDVVGIDQDYFDLIGIEFTAGDNFNNTFQSDSAKSVVLNERALKKLELHSAVGEEILIGGRSRKIIGIVRDHHHTSLHSSTVPLAYFIFPPGSRVSPDNLLVKLDERNISNSLADLEQVWSKQSSDPFQYNFVDEAFANSYRQERRFTALISAFTIVAIIISFVGLFGLINFMTEKKFKEISIRRVLGATQWNLLKLIGKELFLVYLMSLLIALPFAYYLGDMWLDNYAYHIDIKLWTLIFASIFCLMVAGIVVFYHLHRSNRLHPNVYLSRES